MRFRIFDTKDEYDTVDASYVSEDEYGFRFHGPDGELLGWWAKDMLRGFCAVKEEA